MNPVIILWAHPRSMSTAIERVMRERGDFDCLHEPFLHYYYLERSGKGLPLFDSEQGHPISYAATRDLILQRASRSPVFAKDMSYYVMPEILDDADFCHRVRHCFLIRNPMLSIMSYYRLDPDVTRDEIGIEAQWRQYDGLVQMGIDNSLVLEAEAVQADTAAAMRCFWGALGLDYREQALSWDLDSTPADWQYVRGWHRGVVGSSGIRQPVVNLEQAGARFETLCADTPRLREFLQHHQPYYERLRTHSLGNGDGARKI
ncbi:MAG: hypothetical protein OEN02_13005 [Gammaproteobacteria bacterium]|nr:hypothetical protein [Gammaproteobacteria bacterium]